MASSHAQSGSHDATFSRLLREHAAALTRLVTIYEEDRHERQDLLQDIAFAIWRALPSFRGECSERTFVFRIGHNRGLTHRNRRRSSRSTTLDEVESFPDPQADSEKRLAGVELQEQLNGAIRKLAPVHREVIMLRLEGLSNREAATVLGTTENSVAIRLTRARKALVELLGEEKKQ